MKFCSLMFFPRYFTTNNFGYDGTMGSEKAHCEAVKRRQSEGKQERQELVSSWFAHLCNVLDQNGIIRENIQKETSHNNCKTGRSTRQEELPLKISLYSRVVNEFTSSPSQLIAPRRALPFSGVTQNTVTQTSVKCGMLRWRSINAMRQV